MHATRTARQRRLAAAVWLTLIALAITVSPASAQTTETDVGISGTVRNATTAAPVPDVPVRVTYFDDQGPVGNAKATTDADGVFQVMPPAAATGYQVAVDHDGVEFRGVATQLLPGQPSVSTIDVWNVTDDPSQVTTSDWVIWIDQDTETGGWAVQQDFAWLNAGEEAYSGGEDGTVVVPMPIGAGNIQFLGTFLEQQGDVVDGNYVSTAPVVPGESSATIRYVTEGVPALTLPVTFEVGAFSLYVPMGLAAEGEGLRLAGTQDDQGVTYQVYTADALTPGEEIEVVFTEAGETAAGSSDATTYLLIGIAALALIAAGFFFFRSRRSRRPAPSAGPKKARPAQPQNQPKAKPTAQVATRPANGQRAARPNVARDEPEDDDEVQLLIDEIATLDLSFEKGLIDERTYRRLRVAAKDRLLLAQEAASGSRSTR
jgi:LPXTG-motif cell wall-anchored protein